MNVLLALLIAAAAGAAIAWWLAGARAAAARAEALGAMQRENAQLAERASRVALLDEQCTALERTLMDARQEIGAAQAGAQAKTEELAALAARQAALEKEVEAAQDQESALQSALAKTTTLLEEERRQSAEKLALLENAKTALTDQFKVLASDILEEKSKRFAEQNQTSLAQLLDPLRTRLQEFQGKVEEVYVQEGKDRASLAEQVRNLMELNQKMSQEANNLTRALKGQAKTQGNWGEMILERILESSGLKRGREYETQALYQQDNGEQGQPDVVIHLPEGRHLIIDAKVSLNAYDEYVNHEEELRRTEALARHLASVRGHMRGLSPKSYQTLKGLNSIDFVVMFVPIEPAFLLAIERDGELWHDGWKSNILLVSPSTLLFVLRTVQHLWRQADQNSNAQEIATRGAALYDKLAGFVEDLGAVGRNLEQAKNSFDAASAKLSTGRGNLLRQAEMLRELGLKTKKQLVKQSEPEAQEDTPLLEDGVDTSTTQPK